MALDGSCHTCYSKYTDDTVRTNVTFSQGYIPALIEDQRERLRGHDMRLMDAMLQYEDMREGLHKLREEHGEELVAARENAVQGECCVCLDDLGSAAYTTTTVCGHVYHTNCLVETLSSGTVTSCPMCRTDIKKLVGNDLSGKVFRFMCLVRINMDTTQSCARSVKREIENEIDRCSDEALAMQKWRMLSVLNGERRNSLRARVLHLRTRLQLLEQFAQANIEGFQDIFKHVGYVLGPELERACENHSAEHMDIFRDGGVDGDYMRLSRRLSDVFRQIGINKSVQLAHEEKLRAERGLSEPSYSEAHFARCSSVDSKADDDIKGGCFVALAPRSAAKRLSAT